MHIHSDNSILTFIISFLAGLFTIVTSPAFIAELQTIILAIPQAIVLGIISVLTKKTVNSLLLWWKKRKAEEV